MKNRKWMLCLPLALMLFLTFTPMTYADLYVSGGMPEGLPKNLPKQVLDQMSEQFKAKTETTKNYLTSYASRTETGDMIIIMEFDTMTIYQLDPRAKTYTKLNIMAEIGQMAEEMMKDMKVTPINETKEIAGYKCKKYNVAVNALCPDFTVTEAVTTFLKDVDTTGWQDPEIWGKYAVMVAAQDAGSLTGKILDEPALREIFGPLE